MRIRLASDLHDDVGGILTKVAMQSEILEDEVSLEHKNTLNSISKSCRAAMASMRDMVWSIDARNANFESLFDKMSEYGHQMLDAAGLNYTINFDNSLNSIALSPIQKQEIYYIYKEAINNVVKHSFSKNAVIEAEKNP